MSETTGAATESPHINEAAPLFPLRLSDFEFYMLADDRPSHPMAFSVFANVQGELQPTPFRQSLRAAIEVNPLLDCTIREQPGQGLCWVRLPHDENDSFLEWSDFADNSEFPPITIPWIDLTAERGFRVRVCSTAGSARVEFIFHHSCCDGIAGVQLLGEVFARYGCLTSQPEEKSPSFTPPTPNLLLSRERFDEVARSKKGRLASLSRAIAKIGRMFLRRPTPLAAVPSDKHADHGTAAGILTRMLPRELLKGLMAVAREHSVSLNDVCIRELMLQIFDWNQRANRGRLSDWIRVTVPLSMRSPEHAGMPATNIVSYGFVTRRSSECLNPDDLLQSIHRQTGDILFLREGIVFLKFAKFMRRFGGALKAALNMKSCFCTAVLANVGDLRRRFDGRFPLVDGQWKAGNVLITSIGGAPPVRPNTAVAMTIADYAGQLMVNLQSDPNMLTPSQATQFLDEFIDRLKKRVESQPPMQTAD